MISLRHVCTFTFEVVSLSLQLRKFKIAKDKRYLEPSFVQGIIPFILNGFSCFDVWFCQCNMVLIKYRAARKKAVKTSL